MFLSCAPTARNFVQVQLRWTVIFHCYLTIISERVEMLASPYILQKVAEYERTLNYSNSINESPLLFYKKVVRKFLLKVPLHFTHMCSHFLILHIT